MGGKEFEREEMKHILLLLLMGIVGHVFWHYAPEEIKGFIRKLFKIHTLAIAAIVVAVLVMFTMQVQFGSAKLF